MSGHSPFRLAGAMVMVAGLLAGAAGLQQLRERRDVAPTVSAESLYLTSGAALKRLTTGYNPLAADLYWIRAIQYYGDTKLRLTEGPAEVSASAAAPSEYELLYPLLDLTTTLDPRFNIAYRFGSIFLAEAYPGGAGRPDLAIALLEKGLRSRPDKWEYMQDIGFVHYWWRHDYQAAAEWFARAGEVPGAPWFLKSLAATTLAEGGDRQSSRVMWESIRQSAEIDWLRRDAERRLIQLDAMDFIAGLQAKVDALAKTTGLRPRDWDALIRARIIPGVPIDPANTPYAIDDGGTVSLSPQSPLAPLPDEPQQTAPPQS